VRNAKEAACAGAAQISITSKVQESGSRQWLELEVWDNGPGFPEVVLQQPFEPYISDKGRGSGLGLAICRKIISEHDGTIAIANRADGGAQITIELPLSRG